MRKLAIFLLVLALGAALLVWLDRRSRSPARAPSDEPVPPTARQQPADSAPIQVNQTSSASIQGPLDLYAKDADLPGLPLKHHFVAQDSRTLPDGLLDLTGVELERFDTQTRTRTARVVAAGARARLTQSASHSLELDESFPIALRETRLTYETGSRFAPLTLSVPTLEVLPGLQSGKSPDEVELVGRGLGARGKGLVIDGRGESLTLLEDPAATAQISEQLTAELSSHGALVIRSRPDLGPDTAEIEARDSAHLVLTGARWLNVDADVVRLFGRVERSEPARFVPSHGELEGHVRLEPEEGVFTAERGLVEFDALGRVVRATLDGAPVLEVVLRGAQVERLPPELVREGDTLTAKLTGAGPLELFYEQHERFLFTGPALLELPSVGAALRCDSSISGALDEAGRFSELVADGNAHFDYERLRLASRTLTVRSFVDTLGRPAARLVSDGATTVAGVLPDGRSVDLGASGGLVFERRRDAFLVPSATGVTLAIGGARPMQARADSLRDLDVEASTFVAEGHVELENGQGRGRGERLEAWGLDRGELAGTPELPAHFEFEHGSFDALFVELHSDLVHARGSAHASVVFGGLDYELAAHWVVVEQRPAAEGADGDVTIDAGGGVVAQVLVAGRRMTLDSEQLHALAGVRVDPLAGSVYEPSYVIASGAVHFELAGINTLSGEGERLELHSDSSGRLLPDEGGKVHVAGELPHGGQRFDLVAEQVDVASERLTALGAVIDLEGVALAWSQGASAREAQRMRAVAGYIACDRSSILLSDGVSLSGKTASLQDWSLYADRVQLVSNPLQTGASGGELAQQVQDLVAWGGFTAQLGTLGGVRGSVLELSNAHRSLSISGDPQTADAREAVIERAGMRWSSPRFDLALDTGFLRSQAGHVASSDPSDPEGWSVSYQELEPLPRGDETVQILRQPVWTSGDAEIRANWAMLWVDAAEWRKLSSLQGGRDDVRRPDPDAPRRPRRPRKLLGRLSLDSIGPWLHELYLDGNVEYRVHGERKARGEALYVDMVDGHGWMLDFAIDVELPLAGNTYQLKVQAKWIRSSLDGSLQAENAVATTCTHDVPHYVIRIGSFTATPRYEDETVTDRRSGTERVVQKQKGWDLSIDDNSIRFIGALALPLPRIAGPMNNEFEFDEDAFSVGNFRLPSFGSDSKFGTFIAASITRDIGYLGQQFHLLLNRIFAPDVNFPPIRGSTSTGGRINSRGLDGSIESVFESPGRYRWSVLLNAIYDQGEDHGLVRVPESERGDFRGWFRTRGRYQLGSDEWVDAVLSKQSDPGVQAEWFESDYLHYEERETYLHWRRAQDERYWAATLEVRLEDFRTEVVDQPSLEAFKGRSEFGRLAGRPVLQSAWLAIEHLARFEGDPAYEAPFADGLGERSELRIDGGERLEMPLATGVLGSRVTPYVEARATGWSDNAAEDGRAGRAALIAGAQASTTLWKNFPGGARHVWTPTIAYHGDVADAQGGGPVAQFDSVDAPITGRFMDLSLRSRWENRELKSDLDIELARTLAEGTDSPQQDGWQPLITRATWLSMLAGMPFGVTHDARYDLDSGQTEYSRTFFGLEPLPDLDLETGFHSGLDLNGQPLYNATSFGARYTFSHKWELEGKETISTRDSGDRLASGLTLRRFGHDFVLEIDSSFIAGEGAPSLRFSLTPLFAWRRSELSMIDRWRALRQ